MTNQVTSFRVGADETTASQLQKDLREAIIRLEFPPGTRLSEQELAKHFGVSRQPAREALIGLAKSKLVEIRPHRGTVVVRISRRLVEEARFVREALELAVVKKACQSFDSFVRERIERNLSQQKSAVSNQDHHAFRILDGQFHVLIAKGANCTLAWETIEDMKAHMDRVCSLSLTYSHAREELVVQHQAIIEAIDTHDEERAHGEMSAHLQSILHNIADLEEKNPDLFE